MNNCQENNIVDDNVLFINTIGINIESFLQEKIKLFERGTICDPEFQIINQKIMDRKNSMNLKSKETDDTIFEANKEFYFFNKLLLIKNDTEEMDMFFFIYSPLKNFIRNIILKFNGHYNFQQFYHKYETFHKYKNSAMILDLMSIEEIEFLLSAEEMIKKQFGKINKMVNNKILFFVSENCFENLENLQREFNLTADCLNNIGYGLDFIRSQNYLIKQIVKNNANENILLFHTDVNIKINDLEFKSFLSN